MATTQRPSTAGRTSRTSNRTASATGSAPRKASTATARGGRAVTAAEPPRRRPTRTRTASATGNAPRKASTATARGGRTVAAAEPQRRRPTRATANATTTQRRPAGGAATEKTPAPAQAKPTPDGGVVRWTAVPVPLVHTRIAVPSIRMPALGSHFPGLNAVVAQARWAAQAARATLPPADRMLYYGGVGAMAVVGVLEWPVAVVAGAGLWIAGRAAERQRARSAPA